MACRRTEGPGRASGGAGEPERSGNAALAEVVVRNGLGVGVGGIGLRGLAEVVEGPSQESDTSGGAGGDGIG